MSNENNGEQNSSRFAVLLKPIRNLADIWGIDISTELSEYARSLGINLTECNEDIGEMSMDSGRVDFAEAALLVQGSTSIYSRKVEYLYGLVYNAVAELNRVKGDKTTAGNGSASPQNVDHDADALLNIDEVDFMSLDDDLVQTADPKHITFQENEQPEHISAQDATCEQVVPPLLSQVASANGNSVGGTNFKMLSAHLHPTGALVMNGCPPLDSNLQLLDVGDKNNGIQQIDFVNESKSFEELPTNNIDDDHFGDDDFGPPVIDPHENEKTEEKPSIKSPMNAQQQRSQSTAIQPISRRPPIEKSDPFRLLDPHKGEELQQRPLRVGKTHRRPRPKAKLYKKSDLFVPLGISNDDFLDSVTQSLPKRASIRGFVCCEEIRDAFRSVKRKQLFEKHRDKFLRNGIQTARDVVDAEIADTLDNDEFGDDNAIGMEDYGPDDDNVNADNNMNELNMANGPAVMDLPDITNPVDEMPVSDQLLEIASSYQKACQEYMKQRAWMWEKCTIDTNLVQRVDNWRSRILPVLEEEEKRQEFDIHKCGKDVLHSLKNVDKENNTGSGVRASEVFRANEKYEVCRMFLATLQLANTYRVEICSTGEVAVTDPMLRYLDNAETGKSLISTPQKALKRVRQKGMTPKSARRQPLRPRIENIMQ